MSELLKYPGESSNDALSPEGKAAAHTRRTFLFKVAVALNGAVGLALAVPIIGYLIGPALQKDSDTGSWIPLGSVSKFPVGETTLVDFVSPVKTLGDGQTANVPCWVRRISRAAVPGVCNQLRASRLPRPLVRAIQVISLSLPRGRLLRNRGACCRAPRARSV